MINICFILHNLNHHMSHKVYTINLKNRVDRKHHTIKQFKNKAEFNVTIINPIQHKHNSVSLWKTIKSVTEQAILANDKYIIICEDDHIFSKSYDKCVLDKAIFQADKLGMDILSGGVSWFTDALQISTNLFWIDKFSGLQFTVVFERFFKQILQASFTEDDTSDYKISDLTKNKLVMYPFISTQKEFGYSDVTPKNNLKGRVNKIFQDTAKKLDHLDKVRIHYNLMTKL